jgi:hypothetical protein
MTRRQYLCLGISLCWESYQAQGSQGQEFAVIVHPSNRFDNLSRSKLGFLFLRKISRWPWGPEVAPLDLVPGEPLRRVFAQRVLRISEEQRAAYWIDQRATRGVSPPAEARDAAAAKLWVAARPGGIAYVSLSSVDSTVKVIRIDS